MLVVSAVMYAVSATHWALTLAMAARDGKVSPLFGLETLIYLPTVNVCRSLTV